MPLADYFRRHIPEDPYVQGGVMSRGQNWQMRLGSLAAALGNMDRPGMLGQALAQAGAIYQDQRKGALQEAIERSENESKEARQNELYRIQIERHQMELDEVERMKAEQEAEKEKDFNSRKALQYGLHGLGLDPVLADNPTLAGDFINEEQARRREAAKPPEDPKPFSRPGGILMLNPDGTTRFIKDPEMPEQLTPQEKFLRDRGYDPADPAANERYMRDAGLIKEKSGGLTANGKIDLVSKIASDILRSAPIGVSGEPTIDYAEALKQAQQTADGLIKKYEMDGLPPSVKGATVGGIVLPTKGTASSFAVGDMTVIQTSRYGKMDEADKAALSKVMDAIKSLPPEQQEQARKMADAERRQGKSWAMLWAEMNAQ